MLKVVHNIYSFLNETEILTVRGFILARKSFIHQNIQATENHLTHMSKVANHQFLQSSIAEENATADVSLKHVEDEWLDRREEMLKTRDELNALRTQL